MQHGSGTKKAAVIVDDVEQASLKKPTDPPEQATDARATRTKKIVAVALTAVVVVALGIAMLVKPEWFSLGKKENNKAEDESDSVPILQPSDLRPPAVFDNATHTFRLDPFLRDAGEEGHGLSEDWARKLTVIGDDERTFQLSREWPWSSMGLLSRTYQDENDVWWKTHCSATLIGPKWIATAFHCVGTGETGSDGKPEFHWGFKYYPNMINGIASGEASVIRVTYSKNNFPTKNAAGNWDSLEHDYALLELDATVGYTFGYVAMQDWNYFGEPPAPADVWVLGYSADRSSETASFTNEGVIVAKPTQIMTHTFDTFGGASGGMVLTRSQTGGYWHSGVHIHGANSDGYNGAVTNRHLICWYREARYGVCSYDTTSQYSTAPAPGCPQHLEPVDASECPADPDLSENCADDSLRVGDLCEADGECLEFCVGDSCEGQQAQNNCGAYDIYKVVCPISLTPATTCPTIPGGLRNMPTCDTPGMEVSGTYYCEGDGECMTDNGLDNCGAYDVYVMD